MKKRIKHFFKLILALLVILELLLADSRYRLTVTKYEISSELLPESFDGFKIVQLSDVHGYEFGEGNSRLIKKVAGEKPDIIALTGDLADSDTDMEVIESLFAGLIDIAPVYYVAGNHEYASGRLAEVESLMEEYGVTFLRNSYVLLGGGEEKLVLAGVDDPNGRYDMERPDELIERIMQDHPDEYLILLGHRNYWAWEYPELDADLIFCGHAHGGIVRLPGIGGVIGSGYELFPDYVDGVHTVGTYELVISRGIGNSVRIPRFLNNPEIVSVTLKKQ